MSSGLTPVFRVSSGARKIGCGIWGAGGACCAPRRDISAAPAIVVSHQVRFVMRYFFGAALSWEGFAASAALRAASSFIISWIFN